MPSALLCFGVGVVLFSLAPSAVSFSRGASHASCQDMVPGHIRAQPQDPQRSFVTVHTSAASYLPGQFITVTVRSSRDFMGFLLQARSVQGTRTKAAARVGVRSTVAGPVLVGGTWTLTPPGTHTLHCFSEHDTITHSDKQLKRNLSFVWRAPDAPMGDIQFHITVVQSYFVYWAGIKSAVVRDGSRGAWSGSNITGVDGEGPGLVREEHKDTTLVAASNRPTTETSSPAATLGPVRKTSSGTRSHKSLGSHPPLEINSSTNVATDHLKNQVISRKNASTLPKDTQATTGHITGTTEAGRSDPVTHYNVPTSPSFTASSTEPEGMKDSPTTKPLSPNITAPQSPFSTPQKDVDKDRRGPQMDYQVQKLPANPDTEDSSYSTAATANPLRSTSENPSAQPDWTSPTTSHRSVLKDELKSPNPHFQTSLLLQFPNSTPALQSQTSASLSSSPIPPSKPSSIWAYYLSLQTLHQPKVSPPGPESSQASTPQPQSKSSFHQVLLETSSHQTDQSRSEVSPDTFSTSPQLWPQSLVQPTSTPPLIEPVNSAPVSKRPSIRSTLLIRSTSSSSKNQPKTVPSFSALPSPSPISTPPSTEPSSSSSSLSSNILSSGSSTYPSPTSLFSPVPSSTPSSPRSPSSHLLRSSTFSLPSSSTTSPAYSFSPTSPPPSSPSSSSPFSQSTSPPPGPSPAPRRSLYNPLTSSSPSQKLTEGQRLLIQNHISSSESNLNPPTSRTLNPNPKPHPNLKLILGHESKPNIPNTGPQPKRPSNPSATPDKEGKYPDIIVPRHSTWELGMLLGCSASLGMVLVVGVRYMYRQACGKRTEVTLNDREREYGRGERGLIHVQECGDLVRVRKIRENSLVLLAEYDILASPGD